MVYISSTVSSLTLTAALSPGASPRSRGLDFLDDSDGSDGSDDLDGLDCSYVNM